MIRNVLLPVTGSAEDADVFVAALDAGRVFNAHYLALHVRPDVRRDIAGLAASDGGAMVGLDSMIQQMETEASARESTASDAWHAFCSDNRIAIADTPRENGLTSEWCSEDGIEADWIAEYGRAADLIVVGRGPAGESINIVSMEAALMDSGKPVIVAARRQASPPPAPMNGVVGVAWKDTREAAGAVRAALPFLRAAKHVTIFIVPENDDGGDNSHLRLARRLRWHNAHVSVQPLLEHSRQPAAVLMDAAVQAGCGLLVMGGYGHTRLREAVFGGFTRAVLEDAPLPVLMAH